MNEPTKLFGDNQGVIQNASMPEATFQKKHTAISFQWMRECVAAKIIEPHKIDGKDNYADIFTKLVDGTIFNYHAWDLMWKTPTTLVTKGTQFGSHIVPLEANPIWKHALHCTTQISNFFLNLEKISPIWAPHQILRTLFPPK